jgi:thiol-disulfide isomerase/thioredoxin
MMLNMAKLMDKMLSGTVALAAVTALLSSLGCGREAKPGSERRSAAAAAAAAAPSTAASAAVTPEAPAAVPQAVVVPERATPAELLNAMRGRVTLLSAWASWCGPCRRELPMLQALAVNLKPQGVDVVLVSMDEEKDEAKARSFLKDNAITLKSYFVSGDLTDFKQQINPRWPGMLPASFLFDRSAQLVHFWGGEAFENEITPVVENFVAGRSIETETRYGLAPGKVE